MSFTDYLRLGDHKIFKEVCEDLPKNVTKTLNLLTVRDNVLFTWDFQNNCVLSLNVKAARSKEADNVIHQKLLPLSPPLFSPELLVANDSGTLLAVAGPNGVLVFQLPLRCPPYGAFDNNKEVVYCRSHSLDERLLSCSEVLEVRQVKFHPGSVNDSHLLVLTSDNRLRLYQIENNEAVNLAVYAVGEEPGSVFPGSKTPFLDLFGEIAVDFDFGQPEIVERPYVYDFDNDQSNTKENDKLLVNVQTQTVDKIYPRELIKQNKDKKKKEWNYLVWPVYILRSDFSIYCINIDLNKRSKPALKGPLPLTNQTNSADQSDACSIICLNTSPQILCIAMSNGTLCHSVLLDMEEEYIKKLKINANSPLEVPSKEIIIFERVELELGLTLALEEGEDSKKYKCPIFLHKDESKISRYFATHNTGVHSVNVTCVDELQKFVSNSEDTSPSPDLFTQPSSAEYLVCTKTTISEKINPVIGFSLYYDPTSVITLLGDGNLMTMGIMSAAMLPKIDDLSIEERGEVDSPLKKMLKEPFDQYIQKILKKASTQPVLRLSSAGSHTPEQCYELLQRASQIFREEQFRYYTKAREELEKRIQTLSMLKQNQQKEIERMVSEKEVLQQKAENLAEKYEDIKDKQDELLKKCEQLLMLVSRRKSEPSDAEKKFMQELNVCSERSANYAKATDKLKKKLKYQQIQMENWKAQDVKKTISLSEMQKHTIETNIHDTTAKIAEMIKIIKEYKKQLNLK